MTKLGKVGGLVILTESPVVLDLRAGASVSIANEDGRLIVASRPCIRPALADLLARCEPEADASHDDRDRTSAGPVGDDVL